MTTAYVEGEAMDGSTRRDCSNGYPLLKHTRHAHGQTYILMEMMVVGLMIYRRPLEPTSVTRCRLVILGRKSYLSDGADYTRAHPLTHR